VIRQMVPESMHKLFNNMRKSDARKERRKQASADGEQDVSSEQPRKRKRETFVCALTDAFRCYCCCYCY
jgi:hypothetical protein